ncbi:MAG: DUF72 domain-containing protein [Gammaproteobacteria bacterium]
MGKSGRRPTLEVGARGWDHDAWVGRFYPDDLPAAWRLAYYANEFPSVLVPAQQWQHVDPGEVAGWGADVPERFVFFIEMEIGASGRPRDPVRDWRTRLDPLKDQLGGVLVRTAHTDLDHEGLQALVAELVAEYRVWVEPPGAGEPPAWVEQTGAHWSWVGQQRLSGRSVLGLVEVAGERVGLRALRDLLQGLLDAGVQADEAHLIFAGDPPDIEALHQAITIARLLGA